MTERPNRPSTGKHTRKPLTDAGGTSRKVVDTERRGQDTETCHTELLPSFSFGKVDAVSQSHINPGSPVQMLKRFASLVFEERTGRPPTPDDTVTLRDNDDLAIAAMFGLRHPNINGQVREVINDLGITASGEPEEQTRLERTSYGEPFPALNFGVLDKFSQLVPDTDAPIHTLRRFASLVFEERTGRPPTSDDSIRLRDRDDLAIAAMLGYGYPDINSQVRDAYGILTSGEERPDEKAAVVIYTTEPQLLAYPSGRNPHTPTDPLKAGAPAPYPAAEVLKTIDSNSIFPIAQNTTLPADFYEHVPRIDTRYPRDRKRGLSLDHLATIAEQERNPETRNQMRTALQLFDLSLFEGDYLVHAFAIPGVPFQELSSIEKQRFLRPFIVADPLAANETNALLYAVPEDIRLLAFADLGVTHEMLSLLDGFNLATVSTSQRVLDYLQERGFMEVPTGQRPNFLREHSPLIRQLIEAQRREEEAVISGEDKSEAKELASKIHERKRLPLDCVDGNVFGFYSNTGAIVNPRYLFDNRYQALLTEPTVDPMAVRQTLLHMMGGNYTFGHDHTYLYRNTDETIATSYIGTPPDYGVVRPGNFLFHDLKYLENLSMRADYPLEYLLEYVTSHYVDRMDMYTPVSVSEGLPNNGSIHSFLFANSAEGRFATPLQRVDAHVIPFRALKKDPGSQEYFEYGEECYIAELVDTALQLDLIANKAGRSESDYVSHIGDATTGYYTTRLLEKLRTRGKGVDTASTAVDQVLYMQGLQPQGGRETVVRYLEDPALRLEGLPTEPRYTNEGKPEDSKPPLTCYYEWFTRFASPVSQEELKSRGVPIR